MPQWGNPTTLLPALPRDPTSLGTLVASDLIGYMEILKEMYMPPIHGGFTAADIDFEEPSPSSTKRRRTLSGGSVDLAALGLQMEGVGLDSTIEEEPFEADWDDHTTTSDAKTSGKEDQEDNDHDHAQEDQEDYQDPFEREWAEKWLNGVVRRAQTWLESADEDDPAVPETEAVLRDATAVLALMAGTGAAGGLTRHLLFPLASELAPALRILRPLPEATGLSPETTQFLARLASSPVSPMATMRRLSASASGSTSPSLGKSPTRSLGRSHPRSQQTRAALPVLLHDAPITDHISVGVQTWGSAILLGREMSLRPTHFGLFTDLQGRGTRVLELGAGTGLLSILCRKLLDLRAASAALGLGTGQPMGASPELNDTGLVVATDFHPDVLANLRVCVDLNATPDPTLGGQGIEIAKLDWCTFPAYMRQRARVQAGLEAEEQVQEEELARWLDEPFDLVIASDCVYDPTHAGMIHDVASWVTRLPSNDGGSDHDAGAVLHLLSPIRPTFTPELESIDASFPPLHSYAPLCERAAAARKAMAAGDVLCESVAAHLRGEGLGLARGLRLGVRGGKKAVQGRKGEGRTDEAGGYWWWEVAWG